jgi:hypothetical protein
MAKVRADEVDKYSSGTNYFKLQNDGDVAKVRIMYTSAEDVTPLSVHMVTLNGSQYPKPVNCLRTGYNSPVSECPFCRDNISPRIVKIWVPVYDIDHDNVQLWERGRPYISKFVNMCNRFPNLVGRVTEIERHGAKGDKKTDYDIYPGNDDGTTLDDLPEILDPVGTAVLDKSAEEMEEYIDTGSFAPDDEEDSRPIRRGSSARDSQRRDAAPGRDDADRRDDTDRRDRRTPARRGDMRRDRF